jgi:CheY-specific phosphatase CheX
MIDPLVAEGHLMDSTRLVLERMCSMTPAPNDGLSDERKKHLACMRVQFSGPFRGSLLMAAEDEAAELFAPAFLGVDGEELEPGTVGAVLAEMANMICGATVSRIEPDGLFSLSSPAPFSPLPPAEDCVVELGLDCGCGGLVVQLHIE